MYFDSGDSYFESSQSKEYKKFMEEEKAARSFAERVFLYFGKY